MGGGRSGITVAQPRVMFAVAIAVGRHDLRRVERDPAGDPAAERLGRERGVLSESLRGAAYRPAALVLEFLRQVPVGERDGGRYPVLAQLVEQRAVVVQALLVCGAAAARLHPRPGDREPVGPEPERSHQRDVLAVTVVGIARDIAGVTAANLAWRVAEGVPHRRSLTVEVRCPFDLVRGTRCSPDEL